MWSSIKQQHILPDIDMIAEVVNKLNQEFDTFDLYHHSSNNTEMFEFTYKLDSTKREKWEITFLGKCVASGSLLGFGADYDDCYEDDYITLTEDNTDFIYKMAHSGAISYIDSLLGFVAYSDIDEKYKNNWIDIINKGKDKVAENKKEGNL